MQDAKLDAVPDKGLLMFLRSVSFSQASVFLCGTTYFISVVFLRDFNILDFVCCRKDVADGSWFSEDFWMLNRIKTNREVKMCDSCSLAPCAGKLIRARLNRGTDSFSLLEFEF